MSFLENSEFTARPLTLDIPGLKPSCLFLGQGSQGLELAVFTTAQKPASGTLQRAFKDRKAGRASPVLIVAVHDEGASLCGTSGDQPPIFHCKDADQAERLCEAALSRPNRNAAIRFLSDCLPSLETKLPGVANEGLLSLHELTYGTRNRTDWLTSIEKAKAILGKSKLSLIEALGFSSQRLDNLTDLLSAGEERTALAVLLNEDEVPEIGAGRFSNVSPISYALTKADKENLPWVVMVQGDRVRLYNTKNIGVGRRGRTETYVECQPSLMASDDIGLLWLLFSADALKNGGTIGSILEESKRFAAGVADKLRDRIYDVVVPEIAMGMVKAQNLTNPSKEAVDLTYEMALTVLFRLLFIAYAEDRDLLPYKSNEAYRVRSLKNKAIELAEAAAKNTPISLGDHHWVETAQLWKAVSRGNKEWGVPAYGGTIFSNEIAVSKAGAAIDGTALPNSFFEKALRGLLLTNNEESLYAPVDFRALSVREFGTIYEGLLDSELSLAEQGLTRDRNGTYLPAKDGDTIFVNLGAIYLHDRSGARKSSGSYYTPDFAVEHLLDGTLEPALDEHLKLMGDLSQADRVEQFFDFRVADIAMGSGHFLVAAIDRIERRFALWLEENPTPGIARELQYLREAARNELGALADTVIIEGGQLLRRMIARRCIYGLDLNKITVQLAQLSIWIHTFVPGLPLSLLDHNLVHGNALVGIGSLDEIKKKFDQGSGTLFSVDAETLLGQAAEPLLKLATLSDASVKDIEAGRALMEEARLKTSETKALCDLITAQPVADDPRLKGFEFQDWEQQKGQVQGSPALRLAREILDPLSATHFPIIFPEVFLGRTQGFNVVLGNPPWEKVKVEEYNFWAQKFPGLRGLTQREFEWRKKEIYVKRPDLVDELNVQKSETLYLRAILHASTAYLMGAGDPDLYQAFSWRFFGVLGKRGNLGVVMPRSILNAKGSEALRKKMFVNPNLLEATVLTNKSRWVFDMEPRYTVALLNFKKNAKKETGIKLKGPFNSLVKFLDSAQDEGALFTFDEAQSWNDSYSIPLLPRSDSTSTFKRLREQESFSNFYHTGNKISFTTDLHATSDKSLMDLSSPDCPDGFWPVYKGASFNIWLPQTGEIYAWADPQKIKERIRSKVKRTHTTDIKKPDFLEQFRKPRIAFRDITNRTNTRTVIATLIPPDVLLTHTAPVIVFPADREEDEAYLLGIMSSLIFDWYARRFVETHVTFFILNSLPIPRSNRNTPLWKRVVQLSGRLACPDDRFANWAAAASVDYGLLDLDDKQDKIHELDAVVAHLYGLSEPQLIHIFETFHIGWDYQSRLSAVLKHYYAWSGKV